MAPDNNPGPPTAWPLKNVGMEDYFSKPTSEPKIILDRTSEEFEIIHNVGFGRAEMAQFPENKPVYFHASWAIAACYSSSRAKETTKLVVRLAGCQVDLYFGSYELAQSFLAVLKGLAPTTFTVYELPRNQTTEFERFTFEMGKAGYPTIAPSIWAASIDLQSSSHNRLWKTGEWSDVTVVAGNREFKVHRSVICPRSKFFEKACQPGFLEAETRHISLEEDESTIETLLTEIYGVKNNITGSLFTHYALKPEIRKEKVLATLVKLFAAADKYDIEAIKTRAAQAISDRLPMIRDNWTIVELAKGINDTCPENDSGLRETILNHVEARFPEIRGDEAIYTEFCLNRFLVDAMMDRHAVALESGLIPCPVEKYNSRHPTPPPSPQKARKSSRNMRGV